MLLTSVIYIILRPVLSRNNNINMQVTARVEEGHKHLEVTARSEHTISPGTHIPTIFPLSVHSSDRRFTGGAERRTIPSKVGAFYIRTCRSTPSTKPTAWAGACRSAYLVQVRHFPSICSDFPALLSTARSIMESTHSVITRRDAHGKHAD